MSSPSRDNALDLTPEITLYLSPEKTLQRLRSIIVNIQDLTGWKANALAILAGAASVLSFAPIFAWSIMFLTLPLFILLVDGAIAQCSDAKPFVKAKKAGLIGWSFGFGYFFASLFWIGEAFLVEADKFAWALPFAISLLPASLAIYFGLATAAASVLWRPGMMRVTALALTFTITECARGLLFTGFPWNLLGYTITANDGTMQLASIFGAYGLTAIAILIFSCPIAFHDINSNQKVQDLDAAKSVRQPEGFQAWSSLAYPAVAISLLLGGMAWGYMRLASTQLADVDGVTLRLVQPNTPQKDKWNPAKRNQVFKQLLDTTVKRSGPDDTGLKGVTHVIWPESSFPFLIRRSPQALEAIADMLPEKTTLIAGALRMDDPTGPGISGDASIARKIYNSMLAIDTNGQIISIYDKLHLVPFGEYLPYQNILEAIGFEQLTRLKGGLAKGRGQRIMAVPDLPAFAPLICYEIIFPNHVVSSDRNPKWMLNLTNDAWFGRTSGPYQHLHQARIRAIEEGLPIVRVANTGISAVIDPLGRIINQQALMTGGAINAKLPAALPTTIYITFRMLIVLIELIILSLIIYTGKRNVSQLRRKKTSV